MSEIFQMPFNDLRRGDIAAMLKESYRDWDEYDQWVEQWIAYDSEVFDYPNTVGRCGFATRTEGDLVGFISWDPRFRPDVTIGHNCILPAHQNRGYGSWQVQRAVAIFREQGFERVRVSTGADEFFSSARNMYEKCGFQRCEPFQKDRPDMVFYALELL